jgi:transposase-like protein
MTHPRTLADAIRYFANPDHCREYLVARRWPNGVTCPTCGSESVYFDSSRNGWECKTRHPKRKFTLKTGTIFEDSALGLDKWLPVVWMIANMKNGVSSHEIARSIGVTQKTAWFMLHRIRLAMQHETGGKLGGPGGEVEADETYIGGKARNMHASKRRGRVKRGRSLAAKVAVMALLERHGRKPTSQVRLHVMHTLRRSDVQAVVRKHVEPGTSLNTDAFSSYTGLVADYAHKVIDHAEKYVDGTVHTNGCENFWSLLKRGLHGTYVSVEPFHLFRYLDEQAFRFNNRRDMNDADRFSAVVQKIVGKRLTYAGLTGKEGLESCDPAFA